MRRRRLEVFGENDLKSVEVVALASVGRSNLAIRRATKLTDGQIAYRLNRAKRADGLPDGVGYRTAWRDGIQLKGVVGRIERSLLEDIRRSAMRRLPKKVAHLVERRCQPIA